MGLKTYLITGGSVMVVGGVMIVVGLSTGAKTSVTWDDGPKIVKVHKFNQTLADHEYKQLTINGGSNSLVKLKQGDSDSWRVSGQRTNIQSFNINTNNDELKFSLHDRKRPMIGIDTANQNITITVPKSVKLDKLSIRTDGSGVINNGVTAKDANVTNYYGGVRLNNIATESLKFSGESGNYRLKNVTAKQLHMNDDDGYFRANQLTLQEASHIDSNNTEIRLQDSHVPGLKVTNHNTDININGKDSGDIDYVTGDQKKALQITGKNSTVVIRDSKQN